MIGLATVLLQLKDTALKARSSTAQGFGRPGLYAPRF
jgi:hypothetical protein